MDEGACAEGCERRGGVMREREGGAMRESHEERVREEGRGGKESEGAS